MVCAWLHAYVTQSGMFKKGATLTIHVYTIIGVPLDKKEQILEQSKINDWKK